MSLLFLACTNLADQEWSAADSGGRGALEGGLSTEGDSDTDADADSDTDSDADADSDTGGCDALDLLTTLEVRGSDGVATTSLSSSDKVTLAMIHANPCNDDIVFTTPTSCLVQSWSLSLSGEQTTLDASCTQGETRWSMVSGATETATYAAGFLDLGVWRLSATSEATGLASTLTFSVQ